DGRDEGGAAFRLLAIWGGVDGRGHGVPDGGVCGDGGDAAVYRQGAGWGDLERGRYRWPVGGWIWGRQTDCYSAYDQVGAAARREKTQPLVEALREDLPRLSKPVLPSRGLGKGARYALSLWKRLVCLLEHADTRSGAGGRDRRDRRRRRC
ncbi:MAG: hypothetical protein ACK52Z_08760, partial [Acidobacteriota bacterium]